MSTVKWWLSVRGNGLAVEALAATAITDITGEHEFGDTAAAQEAAVLLAKHFARGDWKVQLRGEDAMAFFIRAIPDAPPPEAVLREIGELFDFEFRFPGFVKPKRKE